ncbi:hypothetical protein EAI60_00515 [Escherichia coli]|nr:hypothetical protein EAI60_00515 [Escherichia coli]
MCIASYNHWRKERAGGGQSPPPPAPPGSGEQNRRCARSAQGAANRRRPLHPRALANKIAAARCPRLIPYGYRVGREITSL